MASRKEYEMLFQLNAQLGGGYNSTFTAAQKELISMQQEISALNKIQSDIAAYQKQQDAVEATGKKLEILQQQYNNIQREISETEGYSSSLENKLLQKQMQIDKTTSSMSAQNAKLKDMGIALQEAGVDVSSLGAKTEELTSEIDKLKKKQEEAADQANNFGAKTAAAFSAAHQAIIAVGLAKLLKEVADQFMACADASAEYESVMAAVRRTVGGSEQELAVLAAEFKQMSVDMPITTTELGKIAETAGQLGVAQEAVTEFTKVMAMLATTTDLTADTAATMLAQFANITGVTDYERLGATVADLGDATATTASKVVEMSQGMAAAASIAGFAETDIMAVSAAVGSLGIESQAGATAMSTLISTLYKAVETGKGLEEFSAVANMSAQEFSEAWGQDAVSTMDAFIQGLNDTERNGRSAIVILDELGITNVRQTKAILGLASAGDLLSGTIEQANLAWEENTALQEKAGIMYGTTKNQLIMMQNDFGNLKIAVGDNFTPELQKLYAIASDVLVAFTEFVEQNPGLVKGVAAFAGIVGTATVALTAYAAAIKVIRALELAKVFAAAAPILAVATGIATLTAGVFVFTDALKGEVDASWKLTAASRKQYNELQNLHAEYEEVSAAFGETHYEAQRLQWKIEELTAEYEDQKQTLEEYKSAHESLINSYDEMSGYHAQTRAGIDNEYQSTVALIAKLEELTATTESVAENKQSILAIIDALNESMPELALNYDKVVNSSDNFTDSLYSIAEAQAEQQRSQEEWKDYVDRVGQKSALATQMEDEARQAETAQQEYEAAYKAYMDLVDLYQNDEAGFAAGTKDASLELNAAREQLAFYNEAVAETTEAYEENNAALEKLKESFDLYQQEQEEFIANGGNIVWIIGDVADEMDKLAELYGKAYEAALSSVEGQYQLWDKAAQVVATSVGSMNASLESQISYWQDYNENLEGLTDRGQDIEGLTEMIASFADGSKDSVNAVAGMAKASDKELAVMVSNWQTLQEEQKTVAHSLAELETDFAESMAAMQNELETTIEEMNLSDEAAESGRNTIQGFIDGAEDMLPAVEAAYNRIADAAMAAIDANLDIHSPSRVMMEKAQMTWAGYINETKAMEPDVAAAMSSAANAGIEAFSSEEAQVVALAPQLMALLAANNPVNTVAADAGGMSSSGSVIINFSPIYNLEGVSNVSELESTLRAHDDNMKEYILEVMEEAGIDAARRAYN